MKVFFLMIVLIVIYAALGSYLQESEIIVKPAYWALYGYVYGISNAIVLFVLFVLDKD